MSNPVSRREFVRSAVLAAAGTRLMSSLATSAAAAETPRAVGPSAGRAGSADVRWLDGAPPALFGGATWGMPWPRGRMPSGTPLALKTSTGAEVPVQSWPLATWPDGSLKWTAHAVPADLRSAEDGYEVVPGNAAAPTTPLRVRDIEGAFEIDTGVIVARVARSGRVVLPSVTRGGVETLRNGRLVMLSQDAPDDGARPVAFEGEILRAVLEQDGPVRAVVRLEGRHAPTGPGRAWMPFIVRLYFYSGAESIRVMHTMIYDGDEHRDFVRGLGLRFEVPLRGELYDRHVRFSGEGEGLFGEAVRTVTGLRRDPGREVREAQIAGEATPPLDTWSPAVSERLQFVPAFADWSLFQSTADGFEILKRTKTGCTWLNSARGRRAGGLCYVGTPKGGAAIAIRNFWESHPSELTIAGATDAAAEVTAWLWSPRAGAMDLRPYHDTMGEETYAEQLQGLDITYEDYEPGFDRPEGVARTSELFMWALPATPSRERLAHMSESVRRPPVLVTTPAWLHGCDVFGGLWAPEDRSTPERAALEDRLAWNFAFYEGQREERRWYGFWNYGDVMHTYDADRHEWRYDVGGFAWDNSELSQDIWLWMYFLRTGRADVFRFAEAMTRHTGEVDVHHLGRFAPLGSRHNVLHWGDSAKQLRISTAANRRYYFYLTGDERFGDLMREQVEAVRTLAMIQPGRKVMPPNLVSPPDPHAKGAYVGFGTDWGSLAAAWLTEWERTGSGEIRDRLLASMRSIAAQPKGFFTGGAWMDFDTGAFRRSTDDRPHASHLSAVFGLVEICAELDQLYADPAFRKAWLEYCELYDASPDEQERVLGPGIHDHSLRQAHSRLTAYAANLTHNTGLARRAWDEFYHGDRHGPGPLRTIRVEGPAVLRPVDEAPWISSNGTAQWGLAAMECLALIGPEMPRSGGGGASS
ncbi:hypothetical protein GALL_230160 [mine drainage metagenome]|uniref:Tat pathway signal sequence domain protein n=1 Tax=mine drainage metagenome TaxID=410659 RepID=A0A1J5RHU6_9ZZZZ